MLSKYNLLVGYKYDVEANGDVLLENPTGIQDETAKAWFEGYSANNPMIGGEGFSNTSYWSSTVGAYPAYVYNENSNLYQYIENYKDYLENQTLVIEEARVISNQELEELGCVVSNNSCSMAPSWVYSTSYWTGDADSAENIWGVISDGRFKINNYNNYVSRGVRPVITISKEYF